MGYLIKNIMIEGYKTLEDQKWINLNPKFNEGVESFQAGPRLWELTDPMKSSPIQELRDLGDEYRSQGGFDKDQYLKVQKLLANLSVPNFSRTNDISTNYENTLFLGVARAGLPLMRNLPTRFPNAHYGFLDMQRNEENLETETIGNSYPRKELDGIERVIVMESMFATGGSAVNAIKQARKAHPNAQIDFFAIFAAPEGILKLEREILEHDPKTAAYFVQVDDRLNDQGFIQPGIGDAGDMAFGLKKGTQYILDSKGELHRNNYNPLRMFEIILGDNAPNLN